MAEIRTNSEFAVAMNICDFCDNFRRVQRLDSVAFCGREPELCVAEMPQSKFDELVSRRSDDG